MKRDPSKVSINRCAKNINTYRRCTARFRWCLPVVSRAKSWLGQEFIRCVDAKLSEISRNPLHHQVVYKDRVHRALTNRFPFSIYFVNEEEMITVFAILHQRRSPESWKTRTE